MTVVVVVECVNPLCFERSSRKQVDVAEQRGVLLMTRFVCKACVSDMVVVRRNQ